MRKFLILCVVAAVLATNVAAKDSKPPETAPRVISTAIVLCNGLSTPLVDLPSDISNNDKLDLGLDQLTPVIEYKFN